MRFSQRWSMGSIMLAVTFGYIGSEVKRRQRKTFAKKLSPKLIKIKSLFFYIFMTAKRNIFRVYLDILTVICLNNFNYYSSSTHKVTLIYCYMNNAVKCNRLLKRKNSIIDLGPVAEL